MRHHRTMATKLNFDAQRAQDVTVTKTAKQPDKSWDTVKEREPMPWVHSEPMPDRAPRVKPRVIRLTLDLSDRTSMDDTSVTWALNLPTIGLLQENTVVYWRELVTNQTETLDWAISGIGAHSYALSGPAYTLRGRFYQIGSSSTWAANAVGAPLAVTIKDTDIRGARVTLHRIGASGQGLTSISGLRLSISLVLVEPGAQYI